MTDSYSEKMERAVQETIDDSDARSKAIGEICDQGGFSETFKREALRLANAYADILSSE